jgi:hypothetical protein
LRLFVEPVVHGRGIIDTSEFERDKARGCIRMTDTSDVKIDGVSGVKIDNLRFNGMPVLSAEEARLKLENYVEDVQFIGSRAKR